MLRTECDGLLGVSNAGDGCQIDVRGLGAMGLAIYKTREPSECHLFFASAFRYPCLKDRQRRIELKLIIVEAPTRQTSKLCH